MDFLDNAINKTKEVFGVACQKTEEVVNVGKIKFDIASLENKCSKDYEALGRLYFEKVKDSEVSDEEANALVAQIREKNQKIATLNEQLNDVKNKEICAACGAAIQKNTAYCSVCGAKLNKD